MSILSSGNILITYMYVKLFCTSESSSGDVFQTFMFNLGSTSLQCCTVLSDILVKNELCIPLERGSNVLSTGEGFICLSPPKKLNIAVLFCSIYKCYSVLSDFHPMANNDYVT